MMSKGTEHCNVSMRNWKDIFREKNKQKSSECKVAATVENAWRRYTKALLQTGGECVQVCVVATLQPSRIAKNLKTKNPQENSKFSLAFLHTDTHTRWGVRRQWAPVGIIRAGPTFDRLSDVQTHTHTHIALIPGVVLQFPLPVDSVTQWLTLARQLWSRLWAARGPKTLQLPNTSHLFMLLMQTLFKQAFLGETNRCNDPPPDPMNHLAAKKPDRAPLDNK